MSTPSTPAASDAAKSQAAGTHDTKSKSSLTTREEELFKIAMLHCLKSGAPEIDHEKFMEYGNFNTMKTTQNTWGKIKAKLFKKKEGGEDGAAPKTPKKQNTPKAAATPRSRKRTNATSSDGGDASNDEVSPQKKARKTPAKKSPTKNGDNKGAFDDGTDDVDGEPMEEDVKAEGAE